MGYWNPEAYDLPALTGYRSLIEGRWFPQTINYKDVLKQGKGTEFRITSIKFNQKIPEYVFTKAVLKQ